MLQKQISLLLVCAVSLFVLSGCGKQKTKPTKKAARTVKASETKKNSLKTGNIVDNPSFEKANIFNKGLYKKAKDTVGKPVGWHTRGQLLNDSSGWVSDEAHSGKHSLKIENVGGTNAYWQGDAVLFKKPANAFEAGIWVKTKKILKNKGRFQLVFDVYLEGKDKKEIKRIVTINLKRNSTKWENQGTKVYFKDRITKVIPYIYASGLVASAYFDDITVIPFAKNWKWKIVFHSGKSTFNIPPAFKPIPSKDLPAELSPAAKALALEDKSTIYEVKGPKKILSSKLIPVDKGKIYRLSGKFKSINNENGIIHFGFQPFSKSKKVIPSKSAKSTAEPKVTIYGSKGFSRNVIFNVAYNCTLRDKWTIYSSNLFSTDDSDFTVSKLPPGTRYIKILILANWGTPKSKLQFKDIIFEESR